MNHLKSIKYALGIALLAGAASCSDPMDEITNVSYNRNFSPTELEARIVNKTNVRLNWNLSAGATNYDVEVYHDSLQFAGSPVKTMTVTSDELPYTITGLEGEEGYSIRVRALTNGNENRTSKWSSIFVTTDREQIFDAVNEATDLTPTSVTLRWPAGESADYITITPGDIRHNLTAAEIAAGAATIEGLTDDTEYKAVMTRGTKTRGTVTFATPLDLGGATPIEAGTDLATAIAAAEDGAILALMPGTYVVKPDAEATYEYGSLTISKNLTIRSAKSSDRAVICGRFQIEAGASMSISLLSTARRPTVDRPSTTQQTVSMTI